MDKIMVEASKCTKCGKCVKICPNNALEIIGKVPVLSVPDACTMCGICEDQCPPHAISLVTRGEVDISRPAAVGTAGLIEAERELIDLLGLDNPAVGVALMAPGEMPPTGFSRFPSPTRHCVSIHMATLGASLYVPAEQHACAAAKAALGMSALPEKVANGKIPYMHGLAASESSAAKVMSEVPRLPVGSSAGTAVGPLRSFPSDPQVVILVAKPKQAMWVANALLFEKGTPRITSSFAGMQASCADATTVPIKTGEVNFTLGCYGCRSAGKLGDEEMYVGIPIGKLDSVIKGLRGLRRAMGRLDEGRAKAD